ncbi:PDR/VanB family oxidoreductase [Umezawaea endophytica]|uniref:PDR/VanB family oxidoreductase n=1 Tax=Umezawaea endophytica TaxID=1654476 RepID=A0A9X2VWF5_9PSEU|nr:PDR/VanB family oxidoreductase [Umezawaea endophytica]MCS7483919.1 PDR/VanB family oxidoreductase [Umezawaea endophytica]
MDRFLLGLARVTDGYLKALPLLGKARPSPPNRALRLTVADRRVVAPDVVALRLVGDGPLPPWQPGCHLDLHLDSGLRRQYSLCGNPSDRSGYRIAVRRTGPGSTEVHDLRPGDGVAARGPRNAFPFVAEGPVLFVAGGIGITAILPMVLEAQRADLDWRLVYTGRSRDSMPFLDELPPRADIRVGRTADLLRDAHPDGAVYCCGPTSMLAAVRRDFASKRLHFERFAPPPVVDGRPFDLELRRSGVVLRVPADRTALDVLRDLRPNVPYSCRQGFCGTCEVGGVRVCVDRPTGDRLVLEDL